MIKSIKKLLSTSCLLLVASCSSIGENGHLVLNNNDYNVLLDIDASNNEAMINSQNDSETSQSYDQTIDNSEPSLDSSLITSSNNQSSMREQDIENTYFEYVYDEYYCQEDDSYIRIFENGLFRYDGKDFSFSDFCSSYKNYIIIDYISYANEELPSSSLVDTLFFKKENNSLTVDKKLSIYKTDFNLNDKVFLLKEKEKNADHATYRYRLNNAEHLLINFRLVNDYIKNDVNEVLNDLGLNSYASNVTSFSNPSYSSATIEFSLYLYSNLNVGNVLVTFVNKTNNPLVVGYTFDFDNQQIIKSTNIDALELNENNLLNKDNYSLLGTSGYYNNPRLYNNGRGVVLSSKVDADEFLANIKDDSASNPLKQLIADVDEQTFEQYNVVLSDILMSHDSSITFDFNNLYIKNNDLFIVVDQITSTEGFYSVVTYVSFVFLMKKNVSFGNIRTIF